MLSAVNAKGSLPHVLIAVLCSNNYLKHQKKFMVFMKAFPAHVHKPFQFKATH